MCISKSPTTICNRGLDHLCPMWVNLDCLRLHAVFPQSFFSTPFLISSFFCPLLFSLLLLSLLFSLSLFFSFPLFECGVVMDWISRSGPKMAPVFVHTQVLSLPFLSQVHIPSHLPSLSLFSLPPICLPHLPLSLPLSLSLSLSLSYSLSPPA